MQVRLLTTLFLLSTLSFGLAGCGGGMAPTNPVAQIPPTTLNGNWLVAGSRVPAVYPAISTSIFVQGNVITGTSAFAAQCPTGGLFASGIGAEGFPLTGTIANDGTFQATSQVPAALAAFSVSLTGNSPLPASPSLWTGTYTIAYTPGTTGGIPCTIKQTANFAATPIAPLTGTYVGVPAFGLVQNPFGAGATVTLQVAQGAPMLLTRGSTSSYQIPLTATLTVANSPCAFTASTATAPSPSTIGGDTFNLLLAIAGSTATGSLSGTLNDVTANGFSGNLFNLAQGTSCNGSQLAPYTFTRK